MERAAELYQLAANQGDVGAQFMVILIMCCRAQRFALRDLRWTSTRHFLKNSHVRQRLAEQAYGVHVYINYN